MKTIITLSHFINNRNKYLQYTHSQSKQFVKNGFKVIVFAPKAIKSLRNLFTNKKKLQIDGVNIVINKRIPFSNFLKKTRFNINGYFYYLSIKNDIIKLINNEDIIFINAHNFHCEGYAAYLLKKKYPKIKVTITFHGSDLESELSNKNGISRLIKVSKVVDSYICVSDKLTNKLKKIGVTNVKTIYNGVELYKILPKQKEKIICTTADLIKSKNINIIIEAFKYFSVKYKDYKLEIIGDGPLRKNLEALVSKYNLNNSVSFTGNVPNIEVFKHMSKSFCFILTSKPEGFGIVYAEAMYNKCITIGTKGEGIDGFIKNGQNGFLVNPDAKEISELLIDILNNKYDNNKIIENSYNDAKKLTWERNANEYLKIVNNERGEFE